MPKLCCACHAAVADSLDLPKVESSPLLHWYLGPPPPPEAADGVTERAWAGAPTFPKAANGPDGGGTTGVASPAALGGGGLCGRAGDGDGCALRALAGPLGLSPSMPSPPLSPPPRPTPARPALEDAEGVGQGEPELCLAGPPWGAAAATSGATGPAAGADEPDAAFPRDRDDKFHAVTSASSDGAFPMLPLKQQSIELSERQPLCAGKLRQAEESRPAKDRRTRRSSPPRHKQGRPEFNASSASTRARVRGLKAT